MKLKFLNHATYLALFFIIVQQGMVALSTFTVASLSQSILVGDDYLKFVFLFIGLLSAAYIPTTLTNYFINKAKYLTYGDYVRQFSEKSFNVPSLYFNRCESAEKSAYFTHEAWLLIEENYYFIVDIVSILLNVAFNVWVIAYFTTTDFLWGYLAALPLTFLCVIFSKNKINKQSDVFQRERTKMLNTLVSGWESILIGNTWNAQLWKSDFLEKNQSSAKNEQHLSLNIDITSFFTLIISALPIWLILIQAFRHSIGNPVALAVLVTTLPRQVLNIQYLSDIISLFVNLTDKYQRTKKMSQNLTLEDGGSGTISWGNIFLDSQNQPQISIYQLDDLFQYTDGFENGRYTIKGNNGTGKTTLLTHLKKWQQDQAFLLPSQTRMRFLHDDLEAQYSTGEKIKAILLELEVNLEEMNIRLLLLDEWNANLDTENREKLGMIIQRLSERVCVIEVLHYFG